MLGDGRVEPPFGSDAEDLYNDLPAPLPGEPYAWGAYPTDERRYEEFIRQALAQVHWSPGLYPDPSRSQPYRNGIVDWANREEDSPFLQGLEEGGWIDPDCLQVGSASRVRNGSRRILALMPGDVALEYRAFSFITLDAPTWVEDPAHREASLYQRLIRRLVELQGTGNDNLYGWLDLMFRFCAHQPLVYYSRYVPSERVRDIAWQRGVELFHVPLGALPEALLAANQSFRFMHLSLSQWKELEERMMAAGMWPEVQILRGHRIEG